MSLHIRDTVRRLRRSLSWMPGRDGTQIEKSFDMNGYNGSPSTDLPDGWESAKDADGNIYYVNRDQLVTTYNDPRQQQDVEYEYPEIRIVTITRDPQHGYGFVAGSERPVVVRCVTEGGPSDGKLLHGDQIHKISSEDVREAPRSRVIDLVRSSQQELTLTVSQPPTISTQGKKSILLNAAKKQQRSKRDSSASRVRFHDESLSTAKQSCIHLDYDKDNLDLNNNVLKVHLETNQTRSFKFDNFTKVKDVLAALQQKLGIKCIEHFGLVLHDLKSPLSAKMKILPLMDHVAKFAGSLEGGGTRCLFRVVFVPKDAYDLHRKDIVSFDYFYIQCCQDVINERFSSDLKCDVALRLASLHMQAYALEKQIPYSKINIRLIEKEFGFGMFLNPSMLNAIKPKELTKMLNHFMKPKQGLTPPAQQMPTPLQAKLHYLKMISELRSFGGKCFMATLVEQHMEAMLLVGPRCGISRVTEIRSFALHMLTDYDLIKEIHVEDEKDDSTKLIKIFLSDPKLSILQLSMLTSDSRDFLTMVQGYHQLFCGGDDGIMPKLKLGAFALKIKVKDINENDDNDYATIDDVLVGDSLLESHTYLALEDDRLSISDTKPELPKREYQIQSTNQAAKQTAHLYDIAPDVLAVSKMPDDVCDGTISDAASDELPMSSIDDLIEEALQSSSENSAFIDELKMESVADSLTAECIDELNKLDSAGVLLDPRLFKDKGVYLDPSAELAITMIVPHDGGIIDLNTLPPPEEVIICPRSPPPNDLPPPPLFNDPATAEVESNGQFSAYLPSEFQNSAVSQHSNQISPVHARVTEPVQTSPLVTEPVQTSPQVTEPVQTSPQVTKPVQTNQLDTLKLSVTPATSLRSRLKERQRMNRTDNLQTINTVLTELSAEVPTKMLTTRVELPEHNTPPTTKPESQMLVDSLIKDTSEIKVKVTAEGILKMGVANEAEVSKHKDENPEEILLPSATPDVMPITEEMPDERNAESYNASVDSRMVDALMQFANELSTDSESESEAYDKNSSSFRPPRAATPLASSHFSPLMIADSHIDISTEEDDSSDEATSNVNSTSPLTTSVLETSLVPKQNHEAEVKVEENLSDSLSLNLSFLEEEKEMDYVNSAILSPIARQTNALNDSVAAAAIDEALDCLASATDYDTDDTTSQRSNELANLSLNLTLAICEDKHKEVSQDCQEIEKQSNITDFAVNGTLEIHTFKETSSQAQAMKGMELQQSPKPPPRKKKQLNKSSSTASLLSQLDLHQSSHTLEYQSLLPLSERRSESSTSFSQVSAISEELRVSLISGTQSATSSKGLTSSAPQASNNLDESPVMRNKNSFRISKEGRNTKHASVIGSPTDVVSTASEVLANCKPIIREGDRKESIAMGRVTVTSRESLLDEIIRNAQDLDLDTLGLFAINKSSPSNLSDDFTDHNGTKVVEKDVVLRHRLNSERKSHSHYRRTDSQLSMDSIKSSECGMRTPRPSVAPPPPPSQLLSKNTPMRASESEADLLTTTLGTSINLEIADALTLSGSRSNSKNSEDGRALHEKLSSSGEETANAIVVGLENDGSFVKFCGYTGLPQVSPITKRTGKYRKNTRPLSVANDNGTVESQGYSKRGIISKILNTIKPRQRSMSVECIDENGDHKIKGGSLRFPSGPSRFSIFDIGFPKLTRSQSFHSLGKDTVSKEQRSHKEEILRSLHPVESPLIESSRMNTSGSEQTGLDSQQREIPCLTDRRFSPTHVLNYTYETHNAFEEALQHTTSLMNYFTAYCATQWAPSLTFDPNAFTKVKESLITEGRQLIANTKQLVVSVSQASGPSDRTLIAKMAASERTLAKIMHLGVEVLKVTRSECNMTSVRECVATVGESYKDMLLTSYKAAGKSIQDENMSAIMQKVSQLTTLLNLFQKTLRSI